MSKGTVPFEYRELALLRAEAEQFLAGKDKAYGQIIGLDATHYRITVDVGTEEGRDLADEVRNMLERARLRVSPKPHGLNEHRTDANEVVAGMELASKEDGIHTQWETWTCDVDRRVVNLIRSELSMAKHS